MVIETLIAAEVLEKFCGISVEVIDMRSVRPLDTASVVASVKKTGLLIVADTAYAFGSIASELITSTLHDCFGDLKKAPVKICSPDYPTPSSPSMTKDYYPTAKTILQCVTNMMNITVESGKLKEIIDTIDRKELHDIPNLEFKGPF
jgi:pyruvate dehydrogenase E1 component beta subunit